MKNFREIELLSLYLDGQLNESESKRLETRLASDLELASVLNDLRLTRGFLRKLPARKAPRNFTLTRKMAGLKPPLPRSYSFFRFSTAVATILLMFTFAANSVARLSFGFGAAAPAAGPAFGMGGGGCDEPCGEALQAAATEAPAIEAPPADMLPAPTTDGTLRESEPSPDAVQTPKEPAVESELQNQAPVEKEAVIPVMWQVILLVVIGSSGLTMWLIQRSASRKWQ